MKVADILRVKGSTLYTVAPDHTLGDAVKTMADLDIGSLVVMTQDGLAGMLSFREVIKAVVGNKLGKATVSEVMDPKPRTCTPQTDLDEARRLMLQHHVRYMPVLEQQTLMGVISFYDVAKAVVEQQDFENRMLKAYIRDWPVDESDQTPPA